MLETQAFEAEIGKIRSAGIRKLVRLALDETAKANGYFFKGQASSSGKYHPACCNVKGGIIRHSKRAVDIAEHLARCLGFDERQRDVCIAALILHDTWKNEFQKHGQKAAETIVNLLGENRELLTDIGLGDAMKIALSVRYHMGRWTDRSYAKPIEDYTPEELVVYLADYLSSRPDIGTAQDDCELPGYGWDDLREAV
jgi:hypothetical protein